jgi:hypothetical protein
VSDAFAALAAVFDKLPPDEEAFTEYDTADLIKYLERRGVPWPAAAALLRELEHEFPEGMGGRLYVSGYAWHEYAARRRKARKRDPKQEARDNWLYQQSLDVSKPYRVVVSELAKQCAARGWQPIDSVNGVRFAVARYAKRHGKELPPRRQDL